MAEKAVKETGGLKLVGAAIDTAVDAPKVERPKRGAEPDEPEFPLLPAGCPVKPLGKNGQICFFLDEQRQLIALDPQKMGKNHIRNLFGRQSSLCDDYWPRIGDNGKPNGWKPEIASDLLMRACAFAGVFDPQGKVRGRGAHRGRNGELILHCGDVIYIADETAGYQDPDLIEGFVYATAPAIPRPDPGAVSSAPGEHLLALFRTWYWARPVIDPMLLLGWNAAAMVGGALNWRPHAWLTGSSATGKTTLQKAHELLHDGGELRTHDATEAALRQLLKQQTIPVFFDELEAEADNRRNAAVIKMARLASSGGQTLRGGQDHQGHEFTIRSCFLFSSILVPPMLQQDRNRLAILELDEIPSGAAVPVLGDSLRGLGRQLRKRLVDQWPRFDATLQAYRVALERHGHGGRSSDQFGTLLACADLLLYDDEPEADLLEEWGERLAAKDLAEKALDVSDQEEAVQYLATRQMQVRGGDEPWPVTRHILAAIEPDADKARERLEMFGMKLVNVTWKDGEAIGCTGRLVPGAPLYLAIANSHDALAKIFKETRWADGGWVQAFQRIKVKGGDGQVVDAAVKRVRSRFAGSKPLWSTLLPLSAIVDATKES